MPRSRCPPLVSAAAQDRHPWRASPGEGVGVPCGRPGGEGGVLIPVVRAISLEPESPRRFQRVASLPGARVSTEVSTGCVTPWSQSLHGGFNGLRHSLEPEPPRRFQRVASLPGARVSTEISTGCVTPWSQSLHGGWVASRR
eukprot:scaffold9426_cov90-Isochrysis_galbana.AAC.8